MRLTTLLLPFALLLAACAAPEVPPTPTPDAPRAHAQAPSEAPRPMRPEDIKPIANSAPPMSAPLPADPVAPAAAPAVSRSCRTDADCAVKDVGSCCGAFPACVNVASTPDPAAVQAQCAKSGMSSTCGFQDISACTCSNGTCTAARESALQ